MFDSVLNTLVILNTLVTNAFILFISKYLFKANNKINVVDCEICCELPKKALPSIRFNPLLPSGPFL